MNEITELTQKVQGLEELVSSKDEKISQFEESNTWLENQVKDLTDERDNITSDKEVLMAQFAEKTLLAEQLSAWKEQLEAQITNSDILIGEQKQTIAENEAWLSSSSWDNEAK